MHVKKEFIQEKIQSYINNRHGKPKISMQSSSSSSLLMQPPSTLVIDNHPKFDQFLLQFSHIRPVWSSLRTSCLTDFLYDRPRIPETIVWTYANSHWDKWWSFILITHGHLIWPESIMSIKCHARDYISIKNLRIWFLGQQM